MCVGVCNCLQQGSQYAGICTSVAHEAQVIGMRAVGRFEELVEQWRSANAGRADVADLDHWIPAIRRVATHR